MRKLLGLTFTLLVGVGAALLGGIVGVAARSDATVMHLTISAQDSRGNLMRSEYWIDEVRALAKVIDATPDGPAIHATGPDWALDVPAIGDRAFLYNTVTPGTGPTIGVRGRLYYLRDSYRMGTARLLERDGNATVVQTDDGTVGAFDTAGLPVWQSRGGVRTVFQRSEPESLPSSAFPASFFAQTHSRRLATRSETTLGGAALRARFPFRSSGEALAGQPLTRVLVTDGDSDRTLQQINVVYAGGIEVVQSLLAAPTPLGRPGGTTLTTGIGRGALFKEDDSSVTVVLVDGTVATSVFAPSEAVALEILAILGGSR